MAIKILGGEGGNRLGSVLRTERSLTYAASADMASRRFGGDFMAKTDTRSDATAEALRLMVEEVARLRRERVSRRELQNAQAYLAGSFPLTIETPNAIAAQVLESLLYGLDLDDLPTYPDRINAVTVNDIERVTRRYLQPQRLSIVLVGEASAFVADLPGVGFDNVEVLSIDELDLSRADLRRSSATRRHPPSVPSGPLTPDFPTTGAHQGDALVRRAVGRPVCRRPDHRDPAAGSQRRRVRSRRRAVGVGRWPAGGRLRRPGGYRTGRGVTGVAPVLGDLPPSGDGGAGRAPGRAGGHRLSRLQLPGSAPRSQGSGFRSSTTSVHRSGRGGVAGSGR